MIAGHRVTLVTGGASGIGHAIAVRLASVGQNVVIADVDRELGRSRAHELKARGLHASFATLDVADPSQVKRVFRSVFERFGCIDVLVNSAGINTHASFEDFPLEDWHRVINVNLDGVFYCMQEAGRGMLSEGIGGKIVNITSVSAERGAPGRVAYGVAKAGVLALTRVAAVEWAGRGVCVNAVAPGYVDTPLLRSAFERGVVEEDEVIRGIPIGRLADPNEIAEVVAFLASPASNYVTGQTLAVDGGFLANYGVASRSEPIITPVQA